MNFKLEQLKAQTNRIIIRIKTLPQTIKALPTIIRTMPEEKLIAYGCIVLGLIFILLAIILW